MCASNCFILASAKWSFVCSSSSETGWSRCGTSGSAGFDGVTTGACSRCTGAVGCTWSPWIAVGATGAVGGSWLISGITGIDGLAGCAASWASWASWDSWIWLFVGLTWGSCSAWWAKVNWDTAINTNPVIAVKNIKLCWFLCMGWLLFLGFKMCSKRTNMALCWAIPVATPKNCFCFWLWNCNSVSTYKLGLMDCSKTNSSQACS